MLVPGVTKSRPRPGQPLLKCDSSAAHPYRTTPPAGAQWPGRGERAERGRRGGRHARLAQMPLAFTCARGPPPPFDGKNSISICGLTVFKPTEYRSTIQLACGKPGGGWVSSEDLDFRILVRMSSARVRSRSEQVLHRLPRARHGQSEAGGR